jgi:hypothetical protein
MKVTGTVFERSQRVAAWCCLAAIAILSLLPGAAVAPVRTSMGGHVEHLLLYAATASITALAYVDHSRFKITLALILYAAALECLQRYSPGRLSSFEDFAFSATGIMLGVAAFHVVRNLRARHANTPSRFANGDMRSSP